MKRTQRSASRPSRLIKKQFLQVIVAALCALRFLATPATAQVPQLINYQGRVAVGSPAVNFNSPPNGQFKFALVNSTGTTAYWSNDGSITGAITGSSQPTAAVSLPVTNGLYSVLLGDTTVGGMTSPIPASVWTNADVRLRVWFNDDTNGSQLLRPDQRLAASGYALTAGGVDLPATTAATIGTLELGGAPFLHAYGANGLSSENTFAGSNAGNFTLSGTLNTGAGYQTLSADTSGSGNTASGAQALAANTTGNGNTASGQQALNLNTTGSYNAAIGQGALSGNTTGILNTASGAYALFSNTTGANNTASGANALIGSTTASDNTANGFQALLGNTTAGENVAVGSGALQTQSFNNGGTTWNSQNVAVGYQALYSNQPTSTTSGIQNSALGAQSLYSNTTGRYNTASGYQALYSNLTGINNTASGFRSLYSNTASSNTANGDSALYSNTTGSNNTADGQAALYSNTSGSNNIALGQGAGVTLTTGSNNIDIGSAGVASESNIIRLGDGSTQTDTYLTGIVHGTFSGSGAGLTGITSTSLASGLTLAGTTTLSGDLNLPATTSASTGVLDIGGAPFLHAFGHNGLADGNTFVGDGAGNFSLTGNSNTAVGYLAMSQNTSGSNNAALGEGALFADTTGANNTASGNSALTANKLGANNTADGFLALGSSTNAGQNVAMGSGALQTQSFNNSGTAWNTNNTALGYQALYSNQPTATTNGLNNTAVGTSSLYHNTTGAFNVALGYNAGTNLTTGSNNIDIGSAGVAGESNIIRLGDGSTQTDTYLTGTIHGGASGLILSGDLNLPTTTSASTGVLNIGGTAFLHDYGAGGVTDGNTFVGDGAGNFSLTGVGNSATGYLALSANTAGAQNTADGSGALSANTLGGGNIAVGLDALAANTTSGKNVAVGYEALYYQSFNASNTAWSSYNVAVGFEALFSNQPTATTNGLYNTAVGSLALSGNTTGKTNVALGCGAGYNLTTGNNNIDIGNYNSSTGNSSDVAGESNIIRIGDGSTQTDTYLTGTVRGSSATLSGFLTAGSSTAPVSLLAHTSVGPFGPSANVALQVARFGSSEYTADFADQNGSTVLQIGAPGYALYVYRSAGLIARSDASSTWDTSSDERIKHDIRPVTGALATLERLRPVRFHYNADFLAKMGGTPDYERFGVVAQEFKQVFPDFVDTGKDGMLSVRMDPIPIVTAAAVQELDAKVKARDARIEALEKKNDALEARLQALEARFGPASPK